jgi:hypothetical protein
MLYQGVTAVGSKCDGEFTVPVAERVRGHQRRHSLLDPSRSLQDGNDDAPFGVDSGPTDLTAEHCDPLAKNEKFDVLGLERGRE